jgi:hypothetical protein
MPKNITPIASILVELTGQPQLFTQMEFELDAPRLPRGILG